MLSSRNLKRETYTENERINGIQLNSNFGFNAVTNRTGVDILRAATTFCAARESFKHIIKKIINLCSVFNQILGHCF